MASITSAQTQAPAQTQGVWAWILQRVTAALLLFLLGTHIFVLHYIPANMNIDFAGVAFRFKSMMYLVIDSGLLAASLFHGLNGVRNIVFDYVVSDRKRNFVTLLLVVTGLGFFIWGAYALMFFIK
jgi:succinate dehydrogenase hydrophobic membrane anchor protein